jgi:hypothetical protein
MVTIIQKLLGSRLLKNFEATLYEFHSMPREHDTASNQRRSVFN